MKSVFTIGNRLVGDGQPCFVIAEAGVNHNGDVHRALELVDIASDAGADAVKFQTFDALRLATVSAPKAKYQAETTGTAESQYEMLKRLELSYGDHRLLEEHCRKRGIVFLSTPFDEAAADLLEEIGVPAFKTPSGELTNTPFLEYVARKGKPMIVSTGMATIGEVEDAVDAIRVAGLDQFAILQCVSNYPADPTTINLRAMATLRSAFGAPVGFSDHTNGIEIAIASVALGACVLEKHFTSDRNLPGPDHRASLEPAQLLELVRAVRAVEKALGDGRKTPDLSERDTAAVARKSLVLARDLEAGAKIRAEDLTCKRPGTGIPPKLMSYVVGRTAREPLLAGTVLTWESLS